MVCADRILYRLEAVSLQALCQLFLRSSKEDLSYMACARAEWSVR